MRDRDDVTRVERSREQARQWYDRLSRWYELLSGRSEAPHIRAGLRRLDVQPGETVLEIGFGPGETLVEIERAIGETGRVFGVDLSEGMAEAARERVREAGLARRIELTLGDAVRLPFDGGAFSVVFMSFVLELFDTPEIPDVLMECRRVLRPGGRLGVVSLERGRTPGLPVLVYEWFHERAPQWIDCRPIRVRQSVEQAGFRIRDHEVRSMWGLPVAVVIGEIVPAPA